MTRDYSGKTGVNFTEDRAGELKSMKGDPNGRIAVALRALELTIAEETWDLLKTAYADMKMSDGEKMMNLILNLNTTTMQIASILLTNTVQVQASYLADMIAKEKGEKIENDER